MKEKPLWLIFTHIVLIGLLKLPTTTTGEVCGDQDWFHGWDPGLNAEYQVMDFSEDSDLVAIGGKFPNTNLANGWYAAIVLYKMTELDVHDAILIESWLL